MTVYTFAVTGMHCASCGLLIDETLEDEVPGVTSSQTSVRKGQTIVTAADDVETDMIVAAISGAGYRATLEAAS